MRAMVMSINKKQMVVMKEDGTFKRLKESSKVSIGDEITLPDISANWKRLNKYSSIAAAIVIVLIGGWQVYAYYTPYGYVNIDINPSIELGFNKYERIISTKGLNEDGEKVLKNTPYIKHSKVEDATKNIVQTASEGNYIKKDQENNILFSIYSPNSKRVQVINTKINSSVSKYLKANGKKAKLINETVSKDDLRKAALKKISVGKLKLYEKARSENPNVTIEDVKDKPVNEIMTMIRTVKSKNIDDINQPDDNQRMDNQ